MGIEKITYRGKKKRQGWKGTVLRDSPVCAVTVTGLRYNLLLENLSWWTGLHLREAVCSPTAPLPNQRHCETNWDKTLLVIVTLDEGLALSRPLVVKNLTGDCAHNCLFLETQ